MKNMPRYKQPNIKLSLQLTQTDIQEEVSIVPGAEGKMKISKMELFTTGYQKELSIFLTMLAECEISCTHYIQKKKGELVDEIKGELLDLILLFNATDIEKLYRLSALMPQCISIEKK